MSLTRLYPWQAECIVCDKTVIFFTKSHEKEPTDLELPEGWELGQDKFDYSITCWCENCIKIRKD